MTTEDVAAIREACFGKIPAAEVAVLDQDCVDESYTDDERWDYYYAALLAAFDDDGDALGAHLKTKGVTVE